MTFTSLSELRKSRGGFDSLMKEVDKISNPSNEIKTDDRFWVPSVDKAGNGFSIIRFLPPSKGEELPWVRIWTHGFQGPGGKWYIENSLTTIGQSDPVSEYNTILWNSGSEADKELARKQKRKLNYICNILILQDSAVPENEGKVFLFKFGKKIFDKIKDISQPNPAFQDEKPVNPFDFWEGANFRLKIRQFEGYRNYDKSEFEKPSQVASSDSAIENIWNRQYPLTELLDSKYFKTYDFLKQKFESVIGVSNTNVTRKAENVDIVETRKATPKTVELNKSKVQTPPVDLDEDDEISSSYFQSLTN
jgi:hypothetical protein